MSMRQVRSRSGSLAIRAVAVRLKCSRENQQRLNHLPTSDQVLVFSGNLGYHGGEADLGLLEKVKKIWQHHPECEIAWDGGINDQNVQQLVDAGVSVLNVGGFVQQSADPEAAYAKLKAAAEAK